MIRVEPGDCMDVLPRLAAEGVRVHAVVTDPPYHLTSIVKRFGGANAAPAKDRDGLYKRASAGFMGKQWDGGDVAFRPETWAAVMAVMLPGAHLIAFSGTRTYHRMACAIEDAGFEVRDQIGWMFASGFPKSHDVSKAIDRAAGEERGRNPDFRNGPNTNHSTKGQPAIVGGYAGNKSIDDGAITDAARDWQGWGTALKPAWEPCILARKPLGIPATNVLSVVEFHLREKGVTGEIRWKNDDVSVAASASGRTSSSLTGARPAAETSAESAVVSGTPSIASRGEKSSAVDGLNGPPRTLTALNSTGNQRAADCEIKSSPLTAGNVPAAAKPKTASSPSTTSTAVEPLIEGLSSVRSTPISAARAFRPVTESFAGIATGLSGSLAHVLIVRDSDGYFVWPSGLPKCVKARSLTIAANVLAHGTGAINVDGCRVATSAEDQDAQMRVVGFNVSYGNGEPGITLKGSADGSLHRHDRADFDPSKGRWPANIIHDGSPDVMAAFAAYGELGFSGGTEVGRFSGWKKEPGAKAKDIGFGDSGTAARFFYSAKADAADRCGSSHPTVKPVDLMAYLCRLVTPPGGTVLDPFAGTGTTGAACMREGFDCILIEREAEYIADIRRRLDIAVGADTPLFQVAP